MAAARSVAFIVGETISPKLSLSNQAHMDTLSDVPLPSSTQAALPPRAPGLTTLAPGNFCVKLVIEVAGAAFARWPPMNMMICSVFPAAEFPDSYTADTTRLACPALILMTSSRSWATFV